MSARLGCGTLAEGGQNGTESDRGREGDTSHVRGVGIYTGTKEAQELKTNGLRNHGGHGKRPVLFPLRERGAVRLREERVG
eukprot:scaffold103124_cov25-Phaeocystis_antarctica.AAC.2